MKGIPLDFDSASGGDIFLRLISLQIHESSSRYSFLKDSLLRQIKKDIEDKDSELKYANIAHNFNITICNIVKINLKCIL